MYSGASLGNIQSLSLFVRYLCKNGILLQDGVAQALQLALQGKLFYPLYCKTSDLKISTHWNKTFPFSVVKATGMEVREDPSVEGTKLFCTWVDPEAVCLLTDHTLAWGFFYLSCLCLLMSVPNCVATPKECLLPLMPLPMQLTETRSPCQSVFSGAMLSLLGSMSYV